MDVYLTTEQFEISTSWKIVNDKRIHNALCLVKDDDKLDVEDVVSAETCVLLQHEEQPEPEMLYVEFKAPAQLLISGLSLISEARHLEIYNHLGEYVTTVRSLLLDDADEDFIAYRSEAELAQPLSGCRIKFLSLRTPDKMWFYGAVFRISAKTREVVAPSPLGASLNFGSIITKLEEEGHQLSGGAKHFAKLLQASSSATPHSLPMLLALLGSRGDVEKQLLNSTKLKTGQNENSISLLDSSKEKQKKKSIFVQKEAEETIAQQTHDNAPFRSMLQELVKESEERLWTRLKKHLEEQEQRQNEKLDRILSLLESKR